MENIANFIAQQTGMSASAALAVFLVLMVWSLIWKGLALWAAAERKEKWWFIALLIINTVGVLEIFYLTFVAKKFSKGTSE